MLFSQTVAYVGGTYLIEFWFIFHTVHTGYNVFTISSKGKRRLTFTPLSIRSIRKLDTCLARTRLILGIRTNGKLIAGFI